MPITQERENIQQLRAAGFSEDQAVLLAEKLETTAQSTSQDLKSFITAELDRRFETVDRQFESIDKKFEKFAAEINAQFSKQEARFERSMRIQLATILSAFVAVTGLAVAVIKLLP